MGPRDDAAADFAARAVAAMEAGDPQLAESIARAGVAGVAGDRAWMAFTLAWVLQGSGRPAEAEAEYRRAIALDPDYASAFHNLGNTLVSLGRFEAAIATFRRVVELEPGHPQAHKALGHAYRETGALEPAISAFSRHLSVAPDDANGRFNRGLTRLLAGDFEAGWPDYECRRTTGSEAASSERRWDGGDLDGRSILLWAEQGFGDTLQFVRYARDLAARGGRVLLQVQPGLRALCGTAPGIERVIAFGDELPAFDRHARLLSLPHLLGTRLTSIPSPVPYLSAEPGRVAAWRRRLAGRPGLRVGLAWQGNPTIALDQGRSLPLATLLPLTRVPGVRLISLQKHQGREQLADLPEGTALEDFTDEADQGPDAFVDTAAIMECLDLVISPDTAVVHLAGALGRPVWLLLKRVPEWRWMLRREDSPWYPTHRLFRQARRGDWSPVVDRVAGDLARLAQADRTVLRPRPWRGAPVRALPPEDRGAA